MSISEQHPYPELEECRVVTGVLTRAVQESSHAGCATITLTIQRPSPRSCKRLTILARASAVCSPDQHPGIRYNVKKVAPAKVLARLSTYIESGATMSYVYQPRHWHGKDVVRAIALPELLGAT